ncbi:exodeoxyribonuclease VII small subunit [bacterium]|nr:exodeoxyribonuclease VII small subunit [bacterium]
MAKKERISTLFKQLETLVDTLDGDVEIEEAVALYEQGSKLLKDIEKKLDAARDKITVLSADDITEEQDGE